jgi:hypothetical protein
MDSDRAPWIHHVAASGAARGEADRNISSKSLLREIVG